MSFFLNEFKKSGETLVAVCDKDLLGKKFREGKKRLRVKKNFYKGRKAEEEEVKSAMKRASILNLVGEKSVFIGVELNLIKKPNIMEIEGIKHAQMCVFDPL